MEMGESRETAISNQVIGFTCEGKCLLPLRLVVMFWDGVSLACLEERDISHAEAECSLIVSVVKD